MHPSKIDQNKFESASCYICFHQNRTGPVPLAATRSGRYKESANGRSETPHSYALRGGREGKKRLDLLARVMLPTTMQLLDRVGLIRGMKCLDAGCGGGHVALLMAGMVGAEGRVIGTDTDKEILALARKDAEAANPGNVEFQYVMLVRLCGRRSVSQQW